MLWFLIGAVALAGWIVLIYNGLVRLRVQTNNAWADIDVQLKRRYDLVPNLVETVKGYAAHEKETLEAVIEARNRAMSAQGPAEKGPAEGLFTEALKSIFALAEAYPQLRAVVRDLNTKVAQFPSNLVAGMFDFTRQEFFEAAEVEREAPRVSFDKDTD